MCSGVEEVVDLTCEGSESAVVDLTHNESVLVTTHTVTHTVIHTLVHTLLHTNNTHCCTLIHTLIWQ